MYESFFGLAERPFELTANPRYLFLTARHREALGMLQYGFSARKGIVVLTGEAGTGKTTMLRAAMDAIGADHLVAYLNNPTLTHTEFVESVAHSFALPRDAGSSKARFLQAAQTLFEERAARGLYTALVIDEAHSMPDELLEEIRLLANIERPDEKLLTVVLVGQPELADRLNTPSLRQLKQRVALRCQLVPLSMREAAAYIAKRIRLAGGDSMRLFTREAVEAIYAYSGGIPRTINVICDNALVSAFAQDEQPVSQRTVLDVCLDFDLTPVSYQPSDTPAEGVQHSSTGVRSAVLRTAPPPDAPATAVPPRLEPSVSTAPVPASRTERPETLTPGSLLHLRPVVHPSPGGVEQMGATNEPTHRSFWSSLAFWRR